MPNLTPPEILASIGVIIHLMSLSIYIHSIIIGKTKPHLFTWIIWSIAPIIGFCAQIHEQETTGTWALATTIVACISICLLSLKYGEKNITRADKIALALSLSAVFPWILTHNPLWSVILVSLIDLGGYIPTIRKSWTKPYDEKLFAYAVSIIPLIISLFLLNDLTFTTALYTCTIIVANFCLVGFCLWRRRVLKRLNF